MVPATHVDKVAPPRLAARLTGRLMERAGIVGMPFGLACARARHGGFGPEDGERLNGSLLKGTRRCPDLCETCCRKPLDSVSAEA